MKKQKPKPLIIVRKTWLYHDKGKRTYAMPELTLLADREGFLFLSRFFGRFARKNPSYFPGMDGGDPDDHEHLDGSHFDPDYSDEMEIRVGIINHRNKRDVFKKYGFVTFPPARGDLKNQYQGQIRRMLRDRAWWSKRLKNKNKARKETKATSPAAPFFSGSSMLRF
jgi:hypothetical protein